MTEEEMLDKMKELVLEIKAKWERLEAENKKLRRRIDTMQEFIDYSEWVVHNAINDLRDEKREKALDYLENCYVVWDEDEYERMEKADEEEWLYD